MISNNSTQQTEVKLLKDENWKLIQQNTFTRWVNQQLKQSANSPQLGNLATDFADGIFLIKLAEVLSGKGLPRFNKKPIMRTQKLDNVSLVLNFFQKEESIKIVNIDSSHIVDHNLKLILGLVWTLILHYSLSHQHFTPADTSTSPTTISNGSDKKETPKQRLLAWIQGKIPGRRVGNFTSTWNDGITLGALVDACTNGSLGEWIGWNSDNALENTQKAMQAAEKLLGVEKLLTPEELTNPAVDEKSVMTYLAQFPKAQPLKQQKSPSLVISGIDRHHIVGIPSNFFVEIEKIGDEIEVDVIDSEGNNVQVDINDGENDDGEFKYKISFVPRDVGEHKINLYAKDQNQPSAFLVETLSIKTIPPIKVVGLGDTANIGEKRRFKIENVIDYNRLDVSVINPDGMECVLDAGSERDGQTVTCCYTPRIGGIHTINVLFNKQHIPNSPFILDVYDISSQLSEHEETQETPQSPLFSTNKYEDVVVWGRGLLPVGTSAHEELSVHVDNCEDDVVVSVKKDELVPVSRPASEQRPSAALQPFSAIRPRQSFVFTPRTSGKYEVTVKTATSNISLGNSPYKITVGPKNISSIRAVGPGLEGGVAEERAVFFVDTHGRANYLEFSIEGPSKTEIVCSDNGEGTAMVEYTPHVSGRYTINITELDTNSHIKDSPFVLWIEPAHLLPFRKVPRPIRIPAFESNDGQVDKQFNFKIPKEIEAETFYAEIYDPNLRKIDFDSRHSPEGNFYSFMPQKEGKHLISIVADKLAVEGWPFVIFVDGPFDPNKIWLSGPALSPTIQTRQKTNFSIDVHNIPKPKRVEVVVVGPDGVELPVEIDLRTCSVYNARYEPINAGVHKIYLTVNDQQIFEIPVNAIEYDTEEILGEEESGDEQLLYYSPEMNDENLRKNKQLISNVGARVASEIPEPVIGLNTAIVFTAPGQHISDLSAHVHGPSGDLKHDVKMEQIEKEKFRISFVPHQSGLHTIELRNNGEIYGSPYKIPVALLGTQRAFMAWADGPGLAVGVVGRPNPFTVWNAKNLGGGELTVSIDGPGKAEVGTVQHPNESNYQVEYTVQSPGLYTISVLFNDAPIGGSPFKVFVKPQTVETLSKTYSPPTSPASEQQPYDYLQMTNLTDSSPKSAPNSTSEFYDDDRLLPRRNEFAQGDYSNLSSPRGYEGDHMKVRASGAGLSNFTPRKPNEFVVDTSATGMNALFVGAVTPHGPTDELSVSHSGGGKFVVKYTIPHDSEALIFVKYGDGQIPGSPFPVRPVHENGDKEYNDQYARD
ncbi:hypothetical protein ACQ4LE_008704 [Meloidogyne hapla]